MLIKDLLPQEWKNVLQAEFSKEYFIKLNATLESEYENFNVFPKKQHIFQAFNSCLPQDIKLVIIGQDPYHGPQQAHGLCFSVEKGIKIPPSLKNIFSEMVDDLQIDYPEHGNLQKWADQGVFLLNNVLSVRESMPQSHRKIGWEKFTDAVIKIISERNSSLVFLLWGNEALKKAALVKSEKHYILTASHPSPLSFYRGFKGCRHFSKANELLLKSGKSTINWAMDSY